MLVRHKDAFPHTWKISLNTSPFGACNQRGEQAKLSPSGTISTKAQLNNRNDCRRPYFKLSNNYKPASVLFKWLCKYQYRHKRTQATGKLLNIL